MIVRRRMGAALIAVAFIASACTTGRGAEPTARVRMNAPTRRVLPNGIPVVVQEHRVSDVVALQLWVRAGSRDETSSESGLAHYLEHMLFKGTPSRPPGFIDRDVERVGGRINAGTSFDYTYYHVLLPASRMRAAMEMMADVATNATLDSALLDHEKSVVLEEMRLGDDNPRRLLMRRLHGLVFAGHPYGRAVIGRAELVRALSRETLAQFYRRHYVPESFAVVVVGAVDGQQVFDAASRVFGRLPRSGSSRLPLSVPMTPVARRDDIEHAGRRAHLGLAWLGPKVDHADTAATDLLASILGQGTSSRLVSAVRDRLGLVTSVSAGYSALEFGGVLTITAELARDRVDDAEAAIVREIRRLRESGVTDAEWRRAVTRAEAQHEFSTETAEGRAFALGRAETVWRIEGELAYLDRVRAVTAAQIRAAARRYLDPGRYVRVAIVPAARP